MTRRARRPRRVKLRKLGLGLSGERALAGKQLIENEPEGVDVTAHRDLAAGDLLGCHEGRRTGTNLDTGKTIRQPGKPEIGDANITSTVDHHIGRLEVTVEDALLMSCSETGTELTGDLHRLVFRQAADTPQKDRQIFTVDVFHRQVMGALEFADIVDPTDVGVGNLERDPHLSEETVQPLRVVLEPLRQEFQSNGLTEGEVVCAVDLPHAATTQKTDDSIATGENRSGNEALRIGYRRRRHRGRLACCGMVSSERCRRCGVFSRRHWGRSRRHQTCEGRRTKRTESATGRRLMRTGGTGFHHQRIA